MPTFRHTALRLTLCVFALLIMPVAHAQTEPEAEEIFKPAIIYVSGANSSDQAFIDMARQGVTRAQKELNITLKEYHLTDQEQPSTALQTIASGGYSPIIAIGHQHVLPVLKLAEHYPDTHFTVIDGLVPPLYQNVQSVTFKDHEGAFLVGMIAAYTSKSHHIGFIGGMDIPLIRNFGLGFMQGAQFVRPNIDITIETVGKTQAAWSANDKAYQLAVQLFEDKGVDVIFSAAGGAGLGVLRAANDQKKLAIGVDSNQNGLYPGYILTSMVKRVDNAVFNALRQSYQGKWAPGIKSLGLAESALDFSVDQHNRHLVTPELIDQVLITRERIVNGLIHVKQYSPN